MEVLKKIFKFRMCRSLGDVEEKSTKPTHHQKRQPQQKEQDQGYKNKKKMEIISKRKISPSVPAGCFPVYVGPDDENKQRFVVKAEKANHPLFQILLEEAESKYGQQRQGPISLPCDVDLFYKVLAEMDLEDSTTNCKSFKDDIEHAHPHPSNLFPLASSWNFIGLGHKMNNSYGLLNQSKLLKLNH